MEVSSADFLHLGGLLLYFGLAGFAWLIPLRKYFGNWEDALKLTIPVSISVQILFGYIFYTFDAVLAHPFLYLSFVLIANALALSGLGNKFWPTPKKIKVDRWVLLAGVMVVGAFIYTRFFDAFSTAAPGAIDTFNHIHFLRDLREIGHLSAASYAPGLHLLMYPANLLFGDAAIYRFAGPVFGLLAGLSMFLLFRRQVASNSAKLLLPALLAFPLLAPLSLQTISFFPTILTFVIFPAILSPFIHPYQHWDKVRWLVLLIVVGLSISVPYLLIQIIPPLIVLAILLWLFRSKFPNLPSKEVVTIGVVFVIGFFFAMAHAYIQTKLFSSTVTFPTLDLIDTNLLTSTFSGGANEVKFIDTASPIYYNFLFPIFTSARDVLSLKDIRSFDSVFSIGAYLWGALSIYLLIWSLRQKRYGIATVSYFGIFFTFVTQTGIFEISSYRGRTAWYLLLIAALTVVLLFDRLKLAKKSWALTIPVLIVGFGLFFPPTFYRPFLPEAFDEASRIVQGADQNSELLFYSDIQELSMLSNNLTVRPLSLDGISKPCPEQMRCYLLIQKEFYSVDPILSQRATTTGDNIDELNAQTEKDRRDFEANLTAIESSGLLRGYDLLVDTPRLKIYRQ